MVRGTFDPSPSTPGPRAGAASDDPAIHERILGAVGLRDTVVGALALAGLGLVVLFKVLNSISEGY